MKLVRKYEQPEANFDLYFLGFDSSNHSSDREGLIELTHNYGTEKDTGYAVSTGNDDPFVGFGHTCISVDNIQAACDRIEKAGYSFKKKLNDGSMNNIAFVLDPDGYWVEIIGQHDIELVKDVRSTDLSTYRMVSQFNPIIIEIGVLKYLLSRTIPTSESRITRNRSSFIKKY